MLSGKVLLNKSREWTGISRTVLEHWRHVTARRLGSSTLLPRRWRVPMGGCGHCHSTTPALWDNCEGWCRVAKYIHSGTAGSNHDRCRIDRSPEAGYVLCCAVLCVLVSWLPNHKAGNHTEEAGATWSRPPLARIPIFRPAPSTSGCKRPLLCVFWLMCSWALQPGRPVSVGVRRRCTMGRNGARRDNGRACRRRAKEPIFVLRTSISMSEEEQRVSSLSFSTDAWRVGLCLVCNVGRGSGVRSSRPGLMVCLCVRVCRST